MKRVEICTSYLTLFHRVLLKVAMLFFSSIGWRLGLQAVTGVVFITFLLGTFYRSASLYHPQRRAILHLKSQKRKIKNKDKEKNKVQDDAPPFFDFTTLRSRTVQLLLASIAISSVGLNTPIFYLVCLKMIFLQFTFMTQVFLFE